jgi:uncharacterized protein Yka (UPF0111/DUF47 family)
MSDATKLTELIRDANREITPADRHSILDLIEAADARIAALERALTEIAGQEHIELMLDPTWAQRIAIAALAKQQDQS